jgi:hypothetical protein
VPGPSTEFQWRWNQEISGGSPCRIRGYKDMKRLVAALERIEQEQQDATNQQVA